MAIIYRFDRFTLIPGAGLYHDDAQVALPPKEFALLSLLVSRRGMLVSQPEIERIVWPCQQVSYSSLTRCVHSLRKILGGGKNRYIQTVPKRGYRMAASVRASEQETQASPASEPVSRSVAAAHLREAEREANRPDYEAQARAARLFERATEVDRGLSAAYSGLAACRIYQLVRHFVDIGVGRRQACEACRRALELDPGDTMALGSLAWLAGTRPGSETEGARLINVALAGNASTSRLHSYHSWIAQCAGDIAEATRAARRAVELDPYSVISQHRLAWCLYCDGDPEAALTVEQSVLTDVPWFEVAHSHTALFLSALERHDAAVDAARKVISVSHGDPTLACALPYVLARAGRFREAREAMHRLQEHPQLEAAKPHAAMAYLALGDYAAVECLLMQARAEACPWFLAMRTDFRCRPVAGEPWFDALFTDVEPWAGTSTDPGGGRAAS